MKSTNGSDEELNGVDKHAKYELEWGVEPFLKAMGKVCSLMRRPSVVNWHRIPWGSNNCSVEDMGKWVGDEWVGEE